MGWKRRRDGEDKFLQVSDEITYFLWVGKVRETVRTCFYSYVIRSRTICGGQRARDGEDAFLQLSDEITYNLWVGNMGDTVSIR